MEQAVSNRFFELWMEKIFKKLEIMDGKLNRMSGSKDHIDGDLLFDNQDLCQLLKVSHRTLHRYRRKGLLPYYMIKGKIYYKSSDLQLFMKVYGK